MRILLIDDDEVSLEVLTLVLGAAGHDITPAKGSNEALRILADRKFTPDAVLTDILMPGLGGAELTRAIKAMVETRVIAMSGSYPPQSALAGTDGFLLKPFEAADLNALLSRSREENTAIDRQQMAPEKASEHKEATVPVLDASIVAKLRGMMRPAQLEELYRTCLDDLEQRLGEVETAIAKGEASAVRHAAHTIKGSCGMAGAREVATAAATLEARSDQRDDWVPLLGDLQSAAKRLKGMLQGEFPDIREIKK